MKGLRRSYTNQDQLAVGSPIRTLSKVLLRVGGERQRAQGNLQAGDQHTAL